MAQTTASPPSESRPVDQQKRGDDGLTVAEASARLGLGAHTIRYYERAGLLRVPRDSAGNRRFGRDELRRLEFLRRMRASGMPMSTLTRYIEFVDQGETTIPQRLAVMEEHRRSIARQLRELAAALAATDYKIATYGGRLDGRCDPDSEAPDLADFYPHQDDIEKEIR